MIKISNRKSINAYDSFLFHVVNKKSLIVDRNYEYMDDVILYGSVKSKTYNIELEKYYELYGIDKEDLEYLEKESITDEMLMIKINLFRIENL